MTDRELLELAAKAAGLNDWRWYEPAKCLCHYNVKMKNWYGGNYGDKIEWNPLNDDGDALRLAVKLDCYPNRTTQEILAKKDNPYAATRRAIVRAAAEIGKDMK